MVKKTDCRCSPYIFSACLKICDSVILVTLTHTVIIIHTDCVSAGCVEERGADSLDDTLGERSVDETLCVSEVRGPKNNPQGVFVNDPEPLCRCSLCQTSPTYPLQAGDGAEGKGHVSLLSSSDHSDIVTLGDLKDDDHADVEEEEAAASEEFYLGTSCSSQYAFTAGETGTSHSAVLSFPTAV